MISDWMNCEFSQVHNFGIKNFKFEMKLNYWLKIKVEKFSILLQKYHKKSIRI